MPVLAVIPARLASTRLPQKPLQLLGGVPLVQHVVDRVREAGVADRVVVATDAEAIAAVVRGAGGEAVLTAPDHESGTDRVAEVARKPEFASFDIIVNVQGDEPFLEPAALAGAIARVAERGDDVGTAAAPLDLRDVADPARVKVVLDAEGRALYFSRSVIPHWRDATPAPDDLYLQHIGLYAFARPALQRWTALPPSRLERAERLEQLRALEAGLTIGVARLTAPVLPGIDTPDDLRRAEQHWTTARGPA